MPLSRRTLLVAAAPAAAAMGATSKLVMARPIELPAGEDPAVVAARLYCQAHENYLAAERTWRDAAAGAEAVGLDPDAAEVVVAMSSYKGAVVPLTARGDAELERMLADVARDGWVKLAAPPAELRARLRASQERFQKAETHFGCAAKLRSFESADEARAAAAAAVAGAHAAGATGLAAKLHVALMEQSLGQIETHLTALLESARQDALRLADTGTVQELPTASPTA